MIRSSVWIEVTEVQILQSCGSCSSTLHWQIIVEFIVIAVDVIDSQLIVMGPG